MKQRRIRARSRLISWVLGLIGLLGLILGLQGCPQPQTTTLLIGAASSLTNVLEAIAPSFQAQHPTLQLNYNFAASGKLTQQIQQGAPMDLFISAAPDLMDQLEAEGLIQPDSRRTITHNRLALIVPRDRPILTHISDLAHADIKRIAVGDIRTVPAGQYAQTMLKTTNLWPQVQDKLIFGQNVRQVLAFVAMGNADAGIVYRSDVSTSDQVQIAFTLDPSTHPPITYPAALLTATEHPDEAAAYLDFLTQPDTQRVFQDYGFVPPDRDDLTP